MISSLLLVAASSLAGMSPESAPRPAVPPVPPLLAAREFTFGIPIEAVASLDGARGLVSDAWRSAPSHLTLFRWSDGVMLESVTLHGGIGENEYNGPPQVLAAPPFVLAWGGGGFELFRVAGDRLAHLRDDFESFGEIVSAALRPDGTVVVIAYTCTISGGGFECNNVLRTALTDGRVGELALELERPRLTLSPSGDLALLANVDDEGGRSVTAVDLANPVTPFVRWQGFADSSSGAFDRSGDRVFATFESGSRNELFDAANIDPGSGEMLGGRSASVAKYYYHGIGTIFGLGAKQRAVVWKWTFIGWETVLFDIGGDTPIALLILPEYFDFPEFLAREDEGWYEAHRDLFSADAGTSLLLADADGSQFLGARTPGRDQTLMTAVRRGFFATRDASIGAVTTSITLWRDTALNRPPVAQAGGARSVECTGSEGTLVRFDGTGSSDPDSTPGTQDDIASFAWSIDGGPPSSDATIEALLARGMHVGELAVTDALGAEGRDATSIDVRDTLAPDIVLTLTPSFDGDVWAHLWTPSGAINDLCDGSLGVPLERLRVPEGAAAAPATFTASATRAIELRRDAVGNFTVRLFGPGEAEMRGVWTDVADDGGFPLRDGVPIALRLAAAPKGKAAPSARWDLDAGGRLAGATAYGEEGDHVVEATGVDASGHAASSSVSLRAIRAAACAATPQNVICTDAGLTRAPLP